MTISINSPYIRSTCQPKPVSLMARIYNSVALARERRALLKLDAHLLRDIGVTDAQAHDEAAKAPWDVPDHWHN